MAKKKVAIAFTSTPAADDVVLGVNMKPIKLKGGKGSFEVEVGKRNSLVWLVAGTPGTSFTITLTPPKGYAVAMTGKHPVPGSIPAGHTLAGGHRYFAIEKKKENSK